MNELKEISLEHSTWEEVGILVPDENGTTLHYMEDQVKLKQLASFNDPNVEHSYFGRYHGTAEENIKCASFIKKIEDDSFWEWLDNFYKRADAIIKKTPRNQYDKTDETNPYSNHLYILNRTPEGKLLLKEYGEDATYFNFDIARTDFIYFDVCVEGEHLKDGITMLMKTEKRNPKASLEERKKFARECFEREVKRAKGEFASDSKFSKKEYDKVMKTIEEAPYKEYYVISLCYEMCEKLLKENMITKSFEDFTYDDYYKCNSRKVYYKIIKR